MYLIDIEIKYFLFSNICLANINIARRNDTGLIVIHTIDLFN